MDTATKPLLYEDPLESQFDGRDSFPGWCAFLMGSLITFFVVYLGIARPVRRELDQLQAQVQQLKSSISQLVTLTPSAQATSDLLANLNRQQQQLHQAQGVLEKWQGIQSQILSEAQGLPIVRQALDDLVQIKDAILVASDRVHRANQVLTSAEVLQERLASSEPIVSQAVRSSESLLALSSILAKHGAESDASAGVLRRILEVRDSLQANAGSIDSAFERLEDLMLLKDSILSRTHNLAEAIETLELSQDLAAQLRRAVDSFQQIRQWMSEVVAAEPVMLQAREALKPLLEITNLRRMNSQELRAVARALRDRQPGSWASESPNGSPQQMAGSNVPSLDVHDVDWSSEELLTAQPTPAIRGPQ